MKPQDFISRIAPGAQACMEGRGILASLSIAQAALESGWGAHAPGNNLFGIKAYGWSGATQLLSTTEYLGGKKVKIMDTFRAYAGWQQSVDDHAAFLTKNSRYRNIIGVSDYKTVCRLIAQDGYATAPDYAQQLTALIEQYRLWQYDELPVKLCIDFPVQNNDCSGAITVQGWAVSTDGIRRVDIYADGKKGLASIRVTDERPDVNKIVNPFGWFQGAEKSGYSCVLPAGRLAAGRHTIDVAAISNNGRVVWSGKSITVKG